MWFVQLCGLLGLFLRWDADKVAQLSGVLGFGFAMVCGCRCGEMRKGSGWHHKLGCEKAESGFFSETMRHLLLGSVKPIARPDL